jgi:hypothetical protein
VFLLSHAARLAERRSVGEWIQAARERSTFMSRALELGEIANGLLGGGLVALQGRVVLTDSLTGLSDQADSGTLLAIARLIFKTFPPSWLPFAVQQGRVCREYIPAADLERLTWIEPALDEALIGAYEETAAPDEDAFLKAMGDAAELLVLAALRRAGANPIHVAAVSDAYGYDIEASGPPLERIEVKGASLLSKASLHVSRNEFEKSSHYGEEWRLVQVVFSSSALIAERIDSTMVHSVRELRQLALKDLVPSDTVSFKWEKSAKVTPPEALWTGSSIALDPDFSIAGLRTRRLRGQP